MSKKLPIPCEYTPPPENYKENYEFKREKPSVRSPLEGWEARHLKTDSYMKEHRPKEYRLATGAAHKFKGRRSGSVYGKRK